MIRKIRSSLFIKVFLLTAVLMAACCTITYLCIAYFSPYIYAHRLEDAEELAWLAYLELPNSDVSEQKYDIELFNEALEVQFEDEFVFHILPSDSEELRSFDGVETTTRYRFRFAGSDVEYTVFVAKNTEKESQIVQAIQKTIPILSVVILAVSIVAAFFCTLAILRLQSANRQLQADIDRERELERQRVHFFSAASHELKTPITIIKGQLQGMLYQVGRYKDREAYLAQALEVTETLEKMVQELLTISRLDVPGYVCKKSEFDLRNLIKERLSAHEDLFTQREMTVEESISPEASVSGDRQLLQKVVDNLLENAAAYSPAGSRIFVKLWQNDNKAKMTIENTDVHIPEGDIPKLFEAFYRVDQSRNRQTGGTGLGLYIVKTILDLHGAEIKIENTCQGVIVSVQF